MRAPARTLIGVHVESLPASSPDDRPDSRARKACRPVVLNPASPLETIEWVLGDVQQVLVMSVNPGFGGQAFIPSALDKIAELRALIDRRGLSVDIEVDGGIKVDNVAAVVRAGANVIVSGSGVFGTPDYAATIAELRRRGEAARR